VLAARYASGKNASIVAPSPRRARGADRAAVRLREVLHDGEPEAGAAGLARAARVRAVEALEDAREVLRADPAPRISDAEPDAARARIPAREHGDAPGDGVPHGVVDEVAQDLADCRRVGPHRRRIGGTSVSTGTGPFAPAWLAATSAAACATSSSTG
jgi:hypothetical protein